MEGGNALFTVIPAVEKPVFQTQSPEALADDNILICFGPFYIQTVHFISWLFFKAFRSWGYIMYIKTLGTGFH